MTTLSSEYLETLQDHHKYKDWGGTAKRWAGPDLYEILNHRNYHLETALDYGCGQETLKGAFPELKWTGYDPGIPELAEKPEGMFDLVTCVDVMEHIEPEYVAEVLQEIADYAKRLVYLYIACAPANDKFMSGPRAGQDVHICVQPPAWWEEQVRALKGVHVQEAHYFGKQTRGQWRERAKFLIEKA